MNIVCCNLSFVLIVIGLTISGISCVISYPAVCSYSASTFPTAKGGFQDIFTLGFPSVLALAATSIGEGTTSVDLTVG